MIPFCVYISILECLFPVIVPYKCPHFLIIRSLVIIICLSPLFNLYRTDTMTSHVTMLWSLNGSFTPTASIIFGSVDKIKSNMFSPLVSTCTCCVRNKSWVSSRNLAPSSPACILFQSILLWLKSPNITTLLHAAHALRMTSCKASSFS